MESERFDNLEHIEIAGGIFYFSHLLNVNKMKTSNIMFFMSVLLLCFVTTRCTSPATKVDDAKENLQDAEQDLAKSLKDSTEAADWKEFKVAAQTKIDANRSDIAALREKKSKGGKFMDPIYGEQILTLEQRSLALQTRIDDYEKYHSNWETFKREFDHDMEEIGKSLKDISADNIK